MPEVSFAAELEVAGRDVTVVGGSAGALGQISSLVQAGARVTVVSEQVATSIRDLAERGHKDRLCVMTFSEFGRRGYENGSKGTDHGSGAPMFLVGGRVKAGVVGDHPSLTKMETGNLVHTVDFRRVYAAVLETWLGVDSKTVLGAGFKPLDVFGTKA